MADDINFSITPEGEQRITNIYKYKIKSEDRNKGSKNFSLHLTSDDSTIFRDIGIHVPIPTDPISKPPVANFTYSPSIINPGNIVTVDASTSFDPDGTIVSYAWSGNVIFGTPNHKRASFIFPNVPSTDITLTVIDNNNLASTKTIKITTDEEPLKQNPVANITYVVNNDGTVTLDGSGSSDPDGNIVLYRWSGTVNISNTTSPQTSFIFPSNVNNATINLTVTDNDNLTGSKTVVIPKSSPQPTITRFIAFADNDTGTQTEEVLTTIMKIPGVAAYIFGGDGPYSKDALKWINMMKKFFNTPELLKKLIISQGNHEHPESESQKAEDQIEEWLPHLKNSNDQLDWLSAQQVGNAYIIVGNTQDLDREFKRDQYNWLVKQLSTAKQLRAQGEIDWIIYVCHKPFFTLKSNQSPYVLLRNLYRDLFRDAQVDFVIHGHNHNTQLWLPMIPNQSDANGEGEQLFTRLPDGRFDFSKDHGWLGIVTGHGAHEWNSIKDSGAGVKNVMHYRDDGKFGFVQIDLAGKEATVREIDVDNKVHYEYKVTRSP